MIDCKNLFAVHPDVNHRLISLREPEAIDLPILSYEVRPFYPERQVGRRMTFDADNGIVLGVDPHFPFKQILVRALRNGVSYETMVFP
jgi:hypothetical protein